MSRQVERVVSDLSGEAEMLFEEQTVGIGSRMGVPPPKRHRFSRNHYVSCVCNLAMV